MRDEYEIQLLEIRQGLKEEERKLRSSDCPSLSRFRRLIKLKDLVHAELASYRSGSKKNLDIIRLIGGDSA
jgi:hypothetical protein